MILDYNDLISTQTFTILGILTAFYFFQRFASFVWLYYLRPPSLHKFLHGKEPYALITGASDGIGRAVAKELYERGFNLILHGRNETKLKAAIDQIHASGKGPKRDIRFFLASADAADVDFTKIVEQFKDLRITLVINNVGGGRLRAQRIDAFSGEDLLGDIRVNALFSFDLTHALLPQLRAAGGPVEVVFVGSQSADIAIPRLSTYAASKSFLYQLTRCLNADETYGSPSQVRFTYWNVGTVITNSLREKPSLFYPLAADFAKNLMGIIGCGREKVTPYAPHAMQQLLVGLLPKSILLHHATKTIQRIIDETEKRTD
ncbi:hypothetical protein QCA50_018431 [Cerrena zonata]|uniref:Uncharacterized protein n=1 Tax=Cerrena zonata TaxID=2478898 RepID=A0AAW0FHX9_9APHY